VSFGGFFRELGCERDLDDFVGRDGMSACDADHGTLFGFLGICAVSFGAWLEVMCSGGGVGESMVGR
jgi:hypothetical protein